MAKDENKIYDYFKCEDFVFNGKYAKKWMPITEE